MTAGRIFSVPYIFVALFSPVVGFFVDKYGKKVTMSKLESLLNCIVIVAYIMLASTHLMNLLLPSCPENEVCYIGILPIVFLGLSHCLFISTVWTMLPDVIEPEY